MHQRWTSSVSTLASVLGTADSNKASGKGDIDSDVPTAEQHKSSSNSSPRLSLETSAALPAQATPLPVLTLSVLFWLHLGAGVCFFSAFPFIPRMVRDFHIAETDEKVGYYVGLVESLFAVSQFLTVFKWSSLSDRIGRKPVLIAGLAGLAFGTLLFGLAESFTGILLARLLAGSFSGNIGVMTSIIGEVTDRSNQAKAFTLLPLASGLAGTIGPWFGGQFAYPADTFASLDTPFHRSHPYFLPSALSAMIPFSGILACIFLLEETRSPSSTKSDSYVMLPTSEEEEEQIEPVTTSAKPLSARQLLCPQVAVLLLTYGLVATCSLSCLALFPLFSFTPIESGGLGLSSTWIGAGLALRGVFTILVQLGSFSQLQAKFGTIRSMRLSVLAFVLTFGIWAMLPSLARAQHHFLVVLGVILVLLSWAFGNQAWSFTALLMTNRAPSKGALGTMNGMLETVASGVKAIAPTLSSNLFALSVDRQWLHGHLWWMSFLAIALGLFTATFFIEEERVALPPTPSPTVDSRATPFEMQKPVKVTALPDEFVQQQKQEEQKQGL